MEPPGGEMVVEQEGVYMRVGERLIGSGRYCELFPARFAQNVNPWAV
jgi:hypothetical protein